MPNSRFITIRKQNCVEIMDLMKVVKTDERENKESNLR